MTSHTDYQRPTGHYALVALALVPFLGMLAAGVAINALVNGLEPGDPKFKSALTILYAYALSHVVYVAVTFAYFLTV